MITIFTDGSARGNPGPGGWGAILADENKVKEIGGGADHTTNNRMEITAAIGALKTADDGLITLYTDSSYLLNGITKWIYTWQKNNWIGTNKKPVLNSDLWQELFEVVKNKKITWNLIKGHAGIEANHRCDEIATSFADQLGIDLYIGARRDYKVSLDISNNFMLGAHTTKSKKSHSRKQAYSYVSEINGRVEIHKTWEDCKNRVGGEKARFKKVFSKEEENALITLWSK